MQTVCCFTGLNASNRLKTNWLIKTFSTKAHTSLLTHSAAHTKPFLSHSLGKREASTVCTRWVLHRRQRPVAEDRVPFALGVRIGQRSFSALRWDAKPLQQSAPRRSRTPLRRHRNQEFDKAYGPVWHCIVGSNFGSFVTHSTGCFLYFSMENLYILLFKTKVKKALD
ncbi:hypothetical protein GLYMA_08G001400v4 [Glycine max]|uniref:Dynein light chain n=1 Tax=Glycine max TaxID=3847 RepID=A0A368UHR4_SOYBN|nr:hypothetical protein JHK87_015837 [Glycine soja]KAG5024141.1 hypothetical protein JHK86_020055 [Glycine max]KAG5020211.1 hypothetical protein JHK87_016066 [Glycine soja]KAG5071053.1 hypothetical protein JHK86_006264 [Glycine max]KAH1256439.1 Dynein light chain 1, cytoplasmic [Glycine max]